MTPISLYSLFNDRVRQCLRFALVFSPLSETYKKCFIIYPALNNFCTMDWFSEWPDDALQHVAQKFIVAMNLSGSGVADVASAEAGEVAVDVAAVAAEADDDVHAEMSQLEKNLVEIMLHFHQTMQEASEKYECKNRCALNKISRCSSSSSQILPSSMPPELYPSHGVHSNAAIVLVALCPQEQ